MRIIEMFATNYRPRKWYWQGQDIFSWYEFKCKAYKIYHDIQKELLSAAWVYFLCGRSAPIINFTTRLLIKKSGSKLQVAFAFSKLVILFNVHHKKISKNYAS